MAPTNTWTCRIQIATVYGKHNVSLKSSLVPGAGLAAAVQNPYIRQNRPMPHLKIGIQLTSLRLPFKKAIELAHRLGVQAIEIDARHDIRPAELGLTAKRQLRKMLDDYGLHVAAVSFPTRRGYYVEEELSARVEATKRAMNFAFDLGANAVVNQIGRVPEDTEGDEWNLLVEVLTEIGKHGEHCGAVLAAETGTESGEDLARLLGALPSGIIGVNLDPGNLIVNGFSPQEAVDLLGERIVHVHAKDGVRDLAKRRGLEVPLGRGTTDWPALIAGLEDHEYRGYFTVERTNPEDPVQEVHQAVQFLRNM